MVYSQTKNTLQGKFWKALDGKMLIYILWPFGKFYRNVGYFMTIWYILCSSGTFFRFCIMYREKSGNPGKFFSEDDLLSERVSLQSFQQRTIFHPF
jgi:hypothetical protein